MDYYQTRVLAVGSDPRLLLGSNVQISDIPQE